MKTRRLPQCKTKPSKAQHRPRGLATPAKTQAGHQGFPSGRTKEPGLQHPQRRHGSKLRLAEPRQDLAAQKMSPAEAKPSCKTSGAAFSSRHPKNPAPCLPAASRFPFEQQIKYN